MERGPLRCFRATALFERSTNLWKRSIPTANLPLLRERKCPLYLQTSIYFHHGETRQRCWMQTGVRGCLKALVRVHCMRVKNALLGNGGSAPSGAVRSCAHAVLLATRLEVRATEEQWDVSRAVLAPGYGNARDQSWRP